MTTINKAPSIGGVVLQKSQENRLDEILGTFAKTEAGFLRYGEFMHLIIDRAMINNKHTFTLFHEFYNKGVEPDTHEAPDINAKNEKKMSKQKFAYIITKIASKLFPGDKNPIETIFKTILIEKPLLNLKDAIEPPKVLIHDEMNKRILNEIVISAMCDYEQELQRVYTLYITDNLRYNKMMLTWREVSIQNKKMSSIGLVKLLREADIIPGLISPEHVSEICSKITPPITHSEHGFFQNGRIAQIYDKEYGVNDENKIDGDPHFFLHEFQLILSRIALETVGKAQEKKDDERAIRQFFSQNLLIRTNEELADKKELPSINKGFIRRLAGSYKDAKPRKSGAPEEQKIENKILDEEDDGLNPETLTDEQINEMVKKLEKDLPPIPQELEITADNPPPFTKEAILIGPPIPVSKEKGAQEKKPAQKAQPKKKDKDEREIRFAPPPSKRDQLANENVLDYLEAVDDNDVKEEEDPGTMSHIEVAPTLIKEVLYPPEMPLDVSTFLEAAVVSHNTSNFTLALKNYEKAKQEWLNTLEENKDLPDNIKLFFDFSKGLVYESAGKDDLAFQQFLLCRNHVDRLYNTPDKAIPYCGLGSILYKLHDYPWALRCFLKALSIRETFLGPESVDTATMYNNVGCCMIFLDRMQEANSYLDLAHEIFDLLLGPFHYRTITAKRNLSKVKKYSFKTVAPYSQLWKTLQYNKYPVKKKKKKGKKK